MNWKLTFALEFVAKVVFYCRDQPFQPQPVEVSVEVLGIVIIFGWFG